MNTGIKTKGDVNEFLNVLDLLKQELIKNQKIAEQSDKLKSAFLNNISHEIRSTTQWNSRISGLFR